MIRLSFASKIVLIEATQVPILKIRGGVFFTRHGNNISFKGPPPVLLPGGGDGGVFLTSKCEIGVS